MSATKTPSFSPTFPRVSEYVLVFFFKLQKNGNSITVVTNNIADETANDASIGIAYNTPSDEFPVSVPNNNASIANVNSIHVSDNAASVAVANSGTFIKIRHENISSRSRN